MESLERNRAERLAELFCEFWRCVFLNSDDLDIRDYCLGFWDGELSALLGTRPDQEVKDQPPRESARHLAYVEADFQSFRHGGSCRTAACLCGWKGPQRATLEVAVDDALMHEKHGR